MHHSVRRFPKMHIKTAKHRIFLLCALCSSASLDLETTATTTKDAWISLIVLICSSPSQLLLNHEWTCASVRLFRSHALNAPPQTSPTTFYLPLAWAHIARARAACLTCTMRKRIFTQENKHAHQKHKTTTRSSNQTKKFNSQQQLTTSNFTFYAALLEPNRKLSKSHKTSRTVRQKFIDKYSHTISV